MFDLSEAALDDRCLVRGLLLPLPYSVCLLGRVGRDPPKPCGCWVGGDDPPSPMLLVGSKPHPLTRPSHPALPLGLACCGVRAICQALLKTLKILLSAWSENVILLFC